MVRREIEQRPRTPDDDVLSTSDAAAILNQERQAVDQAVRRGKIDAFQDPDTRRIWVSRAAVERKASQPGHLRELESRLSAVEALSRATVDDETDRLRADNVTLREVNVLLLAAAADHEQVARQRKRAARMLRKAVRAEQQANELLESVLARYRDALAQTQLPSGPPPDDGPG